MYIVRGGGGGRGTGGRGFVEEAALRKAAFLEGHSKFTRDCETSSTETDGGGMVTLSEASRETR